MPKRLYQVTVTPTTYGERHTACVYASSEAAARRRVLGPDVRVTAERETPQGDQLYRVTDKLSGRSAVVAVYVSRGCDCVLDSD
jgi:hypothetical protein